MRVGFIGLGLMGSGMTNNLQKAGHKLVVHDQRKEAAAKLLAGGAEWASSPRDVAAQSEIVFTSLPGPPEFEAVAVGKNGLLEGMQKGQPLFDLSTNSPSLVRRLHPMFEAKGAHLLDSPVSGGPGGAASGKMALWVSGDEEIYKKYRPVLDAMGDQIAYIGTIGSASVAKLVHNLAGYMVNTALAECFTMGIKAGVDPLLLWKSVRQGANGRRRTFDTLAEHFLPNSYDPAKFALRLAHKDVSLATQLGKEVGVPMRLANLTLEEMTEALGRGWQARDSRSSMILQAERAGVKLAVDPEDLRAIMRADSNS
jgi:3-hydroxyisobutyrate dehydrogenase-like beta-hydroxyacid dehydrogenase